MMLIQAGGLFYNSLPAHTFDEDWTIPSDQEVMRWFCRACSATEKLTTHVPSGQTAKFKRKSFSRREYLTYAYGEYGEETGGCYFSPNLFYGWRNQKTLQGLTANWLEIDIADHAALDGKTSDEVIAEIGNTIHRSGLPLPTSMVTTGSGGLHLYWQYTKPVFTKTLSHRAQLIQHWHLIAKRLVDTLEETRISLGRKGWAVDKAASKNPAGLMRLPESVHAKTGRVAEYFRGGNRIAFEHFAQALGSRTPAPVAPKTPATTSEQRTPLAARTVTSDTVKPERNIKPMGGTQRTFLPVRPTAYPTFESRPQGVAQGFDTIGQRYVLRDVMSQWERHLANTGKVRKGQRDLTAFHLYNSARRVMSASEAWSYIERLNERYIGLPLVQLKSYLSSAAAKTYYYSLPRLRTILVEELGLPIFFQQTTSRKRQSETQIRHAQARAGRKTSKTRANATLTELVSAIKDVMHTYTTQEGKACRTRKLVAADVLANTRLSKATVYRYWRQALTTVQRTEIMTLPELVQTVRTCSKVVRGFESQLLPLTYITLGEVSGFCLDPLNYSSLDWTENRITRFTSYPPPD